MDNSRVADSADECSFCGVKRAEAKHLVVAPTGAAICDACVDLAKAMVEQSKAPA